MHSRHLGFSPSVSVTTEGADRLLVSKLGHALRIPSPGPSTLRLIEILSTWGGSSEDIVAQISESHPQSDGAPLYYMLEMFLRRGFLLITLISSGNRLATLHPMSESLDPEPLTERLQPVRLSRFASLRRDENELLVECSLGSAKLLLHDHRLALWFGMLTGPQSATELSKALPGMDVDCALDFINLLRVMQAAQPADQLGAIAEDHDPDLRQWESHDLLFHTRSRMGRTNAPYGTTFRFADLVPPIPHPPALKRLDDETLISLPKASSLEGIDFASTLEKRCSLTRKGSQSISNEQLSDFLWHTARVKKHRKADPSDPRIYESTWRPCAAGGAIHELEIYLTVNRCKDLQPGLYRYEPFGHALLAMPSEKSHREKLLHQAMQSAGLVDPPDILITLSSRFARMNWKYQSIAYATTLKNVGALYQQMYLVATALDLAPCALGGGNSETFARVARTTYHAETSVGEFLLSSRP